MAPHCLRRSSKVLKESEHDFEKADRLLLPTCSNLLIPRGFLAIGWFRPTGKHAGRAAGEPTAQESPGPARHGGVVPEPPFDVAVAGVGTGLGQALAGQERPTAQGRKCHFRMELETIGPIVIEKCLSLEILSSRQKCRAMGQFKTFPVPLVDMARKWALAKPMPLFRWTDRIIAYLHAPLWMRLDTLAEVAGEHLCAKANAKERDTLFERDRDPVDFSAQPSIVVIDAHRTAKEDRAGIAGERFGQRMAEDGSPAIESKTLRAQELPEPSGRCICLMQDH
jgi:hypothetical protein